MSSFVTILTREQEMDYLTNAQKYTPLDIMDILPTPEYPFSDDKWDEKNHDFMMNGWIARKGKERRLKMSRLKTKKNPNTSPGKTIKTMTNQGIPTPSLSTKEVSGKKKETS